MIFTYMVGSQIDTFFDSNFFFILFFLNFLYHFAGFTFLWTVLVCHECDMLSWDFASVWYLVSWYLEWYFCRLCLYICGGNFCTFPFIFFLIRYNIFLMFNVQKKSHFFDFLFNLVKVLPLSWSQLNSNQTGLVLNVFILELLNTMWLFLERRCINSFKLIIGVDCKPIWAIVKI